MSPAILSYPLTTLPAPLRNLNRLIHVPGMVSNPKELSIPRRNGDVFKLNLCVNSPRDPTFVFFLPPKRHRSYSHQLRHSFQRTLPSCNKQPFSIHLVSSSTWSTLRRDIEYDFLLYSTITSGNNWSEYKTTLSAKNRSSFVTITVSEI